MPPVTLDPPDVRALQQVREKRDEFRLLGSRPARPVARQRASRHLVEVEQLDRDLPDLGARPRFAGNAWLDPLGTVGPGLAAFEHRDHTADSGLDHLTWRGRRRTGE